MREKLLRGWRKNSFQRLETISSAEAPTKTGSGHDISTITKDENISKFMVEPNTYVSVPLRVTEDEDVNKAIVHVDATSAASSDHVKADEDRLKAWTLAPVPAPRRRHGDLVASATTRISDDESLQQVKGVDVEGKGEIVNAENADDSSQAISTDDASTAEDTKTEDEQSSGWDSSDDE